MGGLTDYLIKEKYLKSPAIIDAFRKIKRADFVPREMIKVQGEDFVNEHNEPLFIGYDQTISQPLTVAFMLELLKPGKGDKVLDVGSGSGWQTSMLCQLVGPNGFVWAIERIPELKDFGQANVKKYHFNNVKFVCGDGSKGLLEQAPFDKIIAAASAQEISLAWKEQLKINGRLVTPVKNSIWLLEKKGESDFKQKEYPGFAFVPLIKGKL